MLIRGNRGLESQRKRDQTPLILGLSCFLGVGTHWSVQSLYQLCCCALTHNSPFKPDQQMGLARNTDDKLSYLMA